MKVLKKVLIILCIISLILVSCEKEENHSKTTNVGTSATDNMMYKFEYIDLLTDDDYLIEYNIGNPSLEAGKSWNNSLYFLSGHMGKAADGYNHAQRILTVYDEQANMLVNTGITNMIEITDNLQYGFYFIAPISDTEYVALCKKQTARIPRDADSSFEEQIFPISLVKFNIDGSFENIAELSSITSHEVDDIKNMLADKDGNIYINLSHGLSADEEPAEWVIMVNSDGKNPTVLSTPDNAMPDGNNYIMRHTDGYVYLSYLVNYDTAKWRYDFRRIDYDEKNYAVTDKIPPVEIYKIKSNEIMRIPLLGEGYDAYFYDHIGLHGQNGETETLLFKWIDMGLSVDLINDVVVSSDSLIFLRMQDPMDGETKYAKISLVPVSSVYGEGVETPPTLRLAIDQENNSYSTRMLKYASSFVRSEKGCQVEIVSYSDTEGGLSANQKLARDISAGDQPDLVVFGGGLSYETLAKQDVFADIYGFIDADPDYDRSDFLNCVLSPFESSDGTLKRLVSEFAIQTMISGKNTVGELSSMTLDDFAGFGSSLSDGQYLVSTISFDGKDMPERLLNNTLPVMLDEFVDFENGKCDFDGIRTLLDICTNSKILAVPGFTDPKSLAEKKLLFAPVYYFDLGYFMLDRYMSFPDGDIQYTGYPTTTGNRKNSAVSPVISTSIIKTSASQNTSWELMKYFISMKEREAEKVTEARDVSDLMNFPCTKKGIGEMIKVARSYRFGMSAGEIENDDGSLSLVISVNAYDLPEEESERVKKNSDLGLEVYFTDEDEKALRSLLDSAGRICTGGSAVLPIITEEASSCFAGVKSIDDVVRLIQNRVNILINE